ncbi:MAG: hypothetical protein AAF934_08460, partial [Bacteroidota bacterium]
YKILENQGSRKGKSYSISILSKHSRLAKAAYFCFCSKSSLFHCGCRKPLGGATVGKGVDFKETKISLVFLVLLEQAKSTVRE